MKKEKDCCVLCNTETTYDLDTPIEEREFYIEGCGQLCEECYLKLQMEQEQERKLRR